MTKICIKNLKNGSKYDFSLGSAYIGDKTFDTALEVSTDSILVKEIANPAGSQTYTIRVFGEPNCFTDKTITITHFDCNCSPVTVNVITPSRICQGDTLPTLTASVSQNATVDWYDAAVNGNLLKASSTTFKPGQIGTYYAEGRSLIQAGCVSSQRVPVKLELSDNPSFKLSTRPATCLGDSAKSDVQLIVENLIEGDKFDYSIGNTYSGNAIYDNAKLIP